MIRTVLKSLIGLVFMILLGACAKDMTVMAPDTQPGDQLQSAYVVGRWCTNRDLTAEANRAAGNSSLLNISQQFWRLRESGKWENSVSGWMFAHYGKWHLEGTNTIILDRLQGEPNSYQARFTGAGANLQLEDKEGHFLVISRCE